MSVEQIQISLEKAHQELSGQYAEMQKELKKSGEINIELQKKVTESEGRIFDLEKAAANNAPGKTSEEQLTFAAKAAKELLANVDKGGHSKTPVNFTKAVTSDSASAGSLITPQYLPGILTPGLRTFRVRDLLDQGRTDSNSIEYMRELVFTNNAAGVAENTLKPESDITFEAETANVRTIAHWMTASKQVLADAPMLESYIGNRLMYGLKLVEENQLLNGDGTGQNLEGVNTVATAFNTDLPAANATIADQLALAIYQVSLSEYDASGIILNTKDWYDLCLLKDANGNYILGGPQALASKVLWGLPVVATNAQAQGTFTVGAFNIASQVWDREDANIAITPYNQDNFVKNMVTILVEERLAVTHYRPAAIVTGSLTSGS